MKGQTKSTKLLVLLLQEFGRQYHQLSANSGHRLKAKPTGQSGLLLAVLQPGLLKTQTEVIGVTVGYSGAQ